MVGYLNNMFSFDSLLNITLGSAVIFLIVFYQIKMKRLERAKKETESVSEIKIKARTKELEELAKGLEDKVRERTKELQEKIEELEKFNQLAIGRELKMVELKEEIKKLKIELERHKS